MVFSRTDSVPEEPQSAHDKSGLVRGAAIMCLATSLFQVFALSGLARSGEL
jgi:hypothetical protein